VKWWELHKARLSEGKRLKRGLVELSERARLQRWNKVDEDVSRRGIGWRKM
jgi:hypothetical protein